jgi:Helix-turn-helix domain of resolvase
MLPEIAEKELARMAEKWITEHPVEISPGRPKKANDDSMKRRVRDSILELYGEGTQLSVAQERIAERYGISPRSVQRIWKERETLGKTKPESIRELIAAIQKM